MFFFLNVSASFSSSIKGKRLDVMEISAEHLLTALVCVHVFRVHLLVRAVRYFA